MGALLTSAQRIAWLKGHGADRYAVKLPARVVGMYAVDLGIKVQQEQGPPQPHFSQTYLFLGNMYEQRGELEKAAEIWASGLGYFPTDTELRSKVK